MMTTKQTYKTLLSIARANKRCLDVGQSECNVWHKEIQADLLEKLVNQCLQRISDIWRLHRKVSAHVKEVTRLTPSV